MDYLLFFQTLLFNFGFIKQYFKNQLFGSKLTNQFLNTPDWKLNC